MAKLDSWMSDFLVPDWPAPSQVKAAVTLRSGGVSSPPYDSFNLATHVGDELNAVIANRTQLQQTLKFEEACWMNQVHGTEVVEATSEISGSASLTADGCWAEMPNIACAVMTADCLPVLACNTSGTKVLAMHAGWRGLAGGILPEGLKAANMQPEETLIWLGPAIGPDAYQVGAELLTAFQTSSYFSQVDAASAFIPDSDDRYLCNLYELARLQLTTLGFLHIYGGNQCTLKQQKEFFSYRRDGQTGRMASLIWIDAPHI